MALEFNGTSQYVDCGNNASLNITEGTWMSWIKIPASSTYERVVHKYTVDASLNVWGYWIQLSDTGFIEGGVGNNTASWGYYKKGSVALDDDSIHHIAASFSNSDGLRIYQDGTEVSGTLGGGSKPSTIGTSGNPLYISAQYGISSFSYGKGQRWDVRVYNRVLSANEIAEIYHRRGADRVWQGLVGRWRLDEKTSGTLAEHTDVAPHNMTSNNSPSPYVASASSEYYYGNLYEAYRAFDGTNSVWGSNGTSGWLKLDYGSENAPVLIGYSIRSYNDTKFQNVMPKNWTFKGSNNDTDWTTLDTRTNITGWIASDWKEFWFSNSTGYRYYMIDITANNGYSLATYIAEMRHFTSQHRILDLSGNGNHGTPYNSPVYQASPHRLRRGVLVS